MKIILTMLFLGTCMVQTISAQRVPEQNSIDRTLSIAYTSDAFAGAELGYMQNPGILQEKDFRIYLRITAPLFLAYKSKSFHAWEVNLGANTILAGTGKFRLTGDVHIFLIHHRQVLGNFLPVGFFLSLTPSFRFSRGYLGLQIHWNQTVATHISHSPYVREAFENQSLYGETARYIQPKDSWFRNTGSHLGIGIEGGREMCSRISLYGDLGIVLFKSSYTGLLDAMMIGQVPVFGELRLLYKL